MTTTHPQPSPPYEDIAVLLQELLTCSARAVSALEAIATHINDVACCNELILAQIKRLEDSLPCNPRLANLPPTP